MLRDREEFDMGESHIRNIVNEILGQLPIGEKPITLLWNPSPRAQMNLINGGGSSQVVVLAAVFYPGTVGPLITKIPDDGSRTG